MNLWLARPWRPGNVAGWAWLGHRTAVQLYYQGLEDRKMSNIMLSLPNSVLVRSFHLQWMTIPQLLRQESKVKPRSHFAYIRFGTKTRGALPVPASRLFFDICTAVRAVSLIIGGFHFVTMWTPRIIHRFGLCASVDLPCCVISYYCSRELEVFSLNFLVKWREAVTFLYFKSFERETTNWVANAPSRSNCKEFTLDFSENRFTNALVDRVCPPDK